MNNGKKLSLKKVLSAVLAASMVLGVAYIGMPKMAQAASNAGITTEIDLTNSTNNNRIYMGQTYQDFIDPARPADRPTRPFHKLSQNLKT